MDKPCLARIAQHILTSQPVMSIKLEIEKYTQDKDPENDQNS